MKINFKKYLTNLINYFIRLKIGLKKIKKTSFYSLIFVVIFLLIAIGYKEDNRNIIQIKLPTERVSNKASVIDSMVSVEIASNLAQLAEIPVSVKVQNLKVSTEIKNELSKYENPVISKPQILNPIQSNRTIIKHIVKSGETVGSISSVYGVTSDTIKWANNLTDDNVQPGKELTILPTNGVLYTVRLGDTYETIARRYSVNVDRLISYNDLEITGLKIGSQIILPDGVLPNSERPGYVSTRNIYAYATGGGTSIDVTFLYTNTASTTPGNKNDWGNCTWYAWERRNQLGGAWVLPSEALGDAWSWNYSLGRSGYLIDRKPSFGAIMQNGYPNMHVAFVESVESNGDVIVSEMNYYGYNKVNKRRIASAGVSNYNYIHEKVR